MFGNNLEKRIAREADKVSSMKEDLDALSWGRVLDIGRQLQSRESDAVGVELGSELAAIAQTNISLAMRLGIAPPSFENQMMASGMEVLEGGFAQAALSHQSEGVISKVAPAPGESAIPSRIASDDPFEGESVVELVTFDPQEPAVEATLDAERSEPESGASPVQEKTHNQEKEGQRPSKERFARFRNLYESRDGGLCLFEDESGHLVAVDASKLA